MTKFLLYDHCIIVIDNDNIILEIFNIRTKKCHNRLNSGQRKIVKNYFFNYNNKTIFNSWNELLDHHNIDNNISISGIYVSYHTNKNIYKRFFHTNFRKEDKYEEYHSNNKIKILANYVDDKLFGEYKEYNMYGNLIFYANYIDNKLNGKYFKMGVDKTYHNFSMTINTNYIDGKINGEYTTDSINKLQNYTYKDDKKHGPFYIFSKRYHEEGRHRLYGEYDNDKLLYINIYTDNFTELKIKQKIYLDINDTYMIKNYIYENNDSYKILDIIIEKNITDIDINKYLQNLCF